MGDFSLRFKSARSSSMKAWIIIALALISVTVAQVSRYEVGTALIQSNKDECLVCVDDIMLAIADCTSDDLDLLLCITESLGAASDCLSCVCEILAIIGGYDDVCPR